MTVRELYRAEQFPVFQNRMFCTREEAQNCIKGDVVLVQDMESGLIFNEAFHQDLMDYDINYQNEQAVSSAFRAHLKHVTDIIRKHFDDCSLIEVGCGKAYFLEHLRAQGFQITGLDPTYEGVNPNVIKAYFTPDIGLKASGIVLRHVLEHVCNPVEFLRQIRNANGGAGKIYIEVPCFDWICSHKAWFDIYYEHVNYFRISDFYRIFGTVFEAGHTFSGQYLYVVADLATVGIPPLGYLEDFVLPDDFLGTVNRHADTIKTLSAQSLKKSIIWGGASKGVIFALFMKRAGIDIDFVVDINPAKQGKYLAATALRVFSPQEMLAQAATGSTIYVMNANYLPEIRQLTHNQFNYIAVEHEYL